MWFVLWPTLVGQRYSDSLGSRAKGIGLTKEKSQRSGVVLERQRNKRKMTLNID